MHRRQHLRVLTHAQIIVRAPDGDLARTVVTGGGRKFALVPFQLGKVAIVALGLERGQFGGEKVFEVHMISALSRFFDNCVEHGLDLVHRARRVIARS